MKAAFGLVVLLVAACAGSVSAGSPLRGPEGRALRWVDAHVEEEIAFIQRVVDINSGTMNTEGVRTVGAIYEKEFKALGMETEWIELPKEMQRAGHLIARNNGKGKRVLLIGHLDTVFEKDSPFQKFERHGMRATGPGADDMKGGNTVILFALRALAHAKLLDDVSVTVILIGDEEKPGSPLEVTRKPLIDAAKQSRYALGFEALVDHMNTVTIARRGFVGWNLRVEGKQGHSSLIFNEEYGYGAIFEAARIIDGFRKALAGQPNLTFSPGRIVGGTKAKDDAESARGSAMGKRNVIPQVALVAGDLRALSPEQAEQAKKTMKAIVAASLEHTRATIRFETGYPPMAPTAGNRALMGVLDRINRDLGYGPIEAVPPMRRGAADISFAAPIVPSLGGLGLFGKGDHSPDEEIDLRSVPVATKRAALLVYRLSSGRGLVAN